MGYGLEQRPLSLKEMELATRMFFWSEEKPPMKFVDDSKYAQQRLTLAGALRMGKVLNSFRGMARCRFPQCGEVLGSQDLVFKGLDKNYIYPSKCEHYVLMHNVWVPEADEFLVAVEKKLTNV